MLYTEVSLMRKFDHRNVIRLRGVFEDSKEVRLVCDRCEGGILTHLTQGS